MLYLWASQYFPSIDPLYLTDQSGITSWDSFNSERIPPNMFKFGRGQNDACPHFGTPVRFDSQ